MNPNQIQKTHPTRLVVVLAYVIAIATFSLAIAGCGTTTTRKATEQLLMSDAVDNAISQIDFRSLQDQKVFIDTAYLGEVPGVGFVNAKYIISSLRQQLSAARCLIQDDREAADIIVEPRVGALGTDIHEVVYGVPQSGTLVNAAAVLTSSPIQAIPEVSFGKSNSQTGIAKLIVFAYDRETRDPVWQSGVATAESTSQNNWYLGAGPFQKGTIHEGTRFAGQTFPFARNSLRSSQRQSNDGNQMAQPSVPFNQPFVFDRRSKADESQPVEESAPDIQTAAHQETFKD